MIEPQNSRFPGPRTRVLVVASGSDEHDDAVSGPAWKLAEALSKPFDVILAVPAITRSQHPDFAVVYYNRRNLALLAGDSDIVFISGKELALQPSLAGLGTTVAASDLSASAPGDLPGYVPPRLSSLAEVREANPGLSDMLGSGGLMVVIPEPPPPPATGLARYVGALRYHLRQGGLRRGAPPGLCLPAQEVSARIGRAAGGYTANRLYFFPGSAPGLR